MPVVPHSAQQSYQARKLAAELPAARIKLPPAVAHAVAAYEQARAVPVPRPAEPGSLSRPAVWEAARQALDSAPPGRPPAVSTAPVEEARRAEQESRDRHEVHMAMLAEAESRVLAAVRHAPALVTAIQDRHAALVAELRAAADQLPAAVDDKVALEQGGPVRSAYLAARDAVAGLTALRALLIDVGSVAGEQADVRGDLEFSLNWTRSRWFYERRRQFPRPPGSLAFWLQLVRECPEDIWCPTLTQVAEAAETMRKEMRQRKIQELPRDAVVW